MALATSLELQMAVPGPVMLFTLSILLPGLLILGHAIFFYRTAWNFLRRREKPITLRHEILWAIYLAAIYVTGTWVQAILQSTYVLAGDAANDYVGVVATAAAQGEFFWGMVKLSNSVALWVIMTVFLLKLLVAVHEQIRRRRRP